MRVSCHCGAVLGELVLVEGYQRCDNDVVLVVMDGVTLRPGVRVMVKGGGDLLKNHVLRLGWVNNKRASSTPQSPLMPTEKFDLDAGQPFCDCGSGEEK